MVDIIHRIGIKASPAQVYAAVATVEGVAGWWTKDTVGDARVGKTITTRFHSPKGEQVGRFLIEVVALDPDKEVRWRIKEGPAEWIGTEVVFALSQVDDYTIVNFGHRNWKEAIEFTAHCSMKWATFLLSLRDLVESGQGKPSPNDLKIDNWN